MSWFNKKEEIIPVPQNELIIPVPDIKQYLVQEYEKVRQLETYTRELEAQLEEAEALQHKYDAAMVVLDEYKNRLTRVEADLRFQKERNKMIKEENNQIRDDLNSYKLKFNQAALVKEDIEKEIVSETKAKLAAAVTEYKGNLSKTKIIQLIQEAE